MKKKIILASVIVVLVLILAFSAIKTIPSQNVGIRIRFGQVSNKISAEGLVFQIPFVDKIVKVSSKNQDVNLNTQIWGETSDKVQVYGTNFLVTFSINVEHTLDLYRITNDLTSESLVNSSQISSSFKDASVQLSSKEATIRSKIEPLTLELLQKRVDQKYGEGRITILQVIINDMNFEESFNAAISERNKAQISYEQKQIENITALETAEAQAQTEKIKAQTEANNIIIRSEAEAKANKIVSESLTEEIIRMKEAEARLVHGWVTVKGADTIVANGQQ